MNESENPIMKKVANTVMDLDLLINDPKHKIFMVYPKDGLPHQNCRVFRVNKEKESFTVLYPTPHEKIPDLVSIGEVGFDNVKKLDVLKVNET